MIVEQINTEYLTSPDEYYAAALNQTLTDREIFNTILAGLFTTKKWASGIKIGDVWLSIPAKHIAVYNPTDSSWKSYTQTPVEVRNILEYPGEVSIDPMEKFVKFTTHLENNIQMGANINRPSALSVMNDKPVDKVFNLVFECTPQSIQNNIRPLIAQFTVSPFLPVHNIDLNRIVNPADENPDPFLALGKAHISRSGKFRFGPPEISGIFANSVGDTSVYFRDETLDGLDPSEPERQLFERIRRASLSEFEQAEIRDIRSFMLWLENRAYLEVPFYIQLIDYHIETIENKANAVQFVMVVRAIDTESAYGMIPLYLKTEEALNQHVSYQNWLKQIARGDDSIVRRIAKAFKINSYGSDYPLDLGGSYSLAMSMRHILPDIEVANNHFSGAIQFTDNSIILVPEFNHPGDANLKPSRYYGPTVSGENTPVDDESTSNLILMFDEDSHPAISVLNKKNTKIEINPEAVTSPEDLIVANSKNGIVIVENTKNRSEEEKQDLKENYSIMQYNLKNFMSSHDPIEMSSTDTLSAYEPDGDGYDLREANRLNTIVAAIVATGIPDIMVFEELGADDISANGKPALIERMAELLQKHPKAGNRVFRAGKFNNSYNDGEYRQGVGYITSIPIFGIPKAHSINSLYREVDNVSIELSQGDLSIDQVLSNSRYILQFDILRGNSNHISIFVCHFRSRIDMANHYIRKIESKCLMLLIDRLPDDRPFIVAGDFNYTWFKDNGSGSSVPGFFDYTIRHSNSRNEENKIIPTVVKDESDFTLNMPVCFEYDFMKQIANNNVAIENTGIPRKHILFNSLGKRYQNFLTNNTPNSRTQIGTFFNEKKTITGGIDPNSGSWSCIDYVFFSYHFFADNSHVRFDDAQIVKALNIAEIGKYVYNEATNSTEYVYSGLPSEGILSSLNRQWNKSVDRRLAERIGDVISEPAVFSDHYPILSNFTWTDKSDTTQRNKVDTTSSLIISTLPGINTYDNREVARTGFKKLEIFGSANIDREMVISNTSPMLDKLLRYETNGTIGSSTDRVTVVVESIYYSKLIGNYVISGLLVVGRNKTEIRKRTGEGGFDSTKGQPLISSPTGNQNFNNVMVGFSIPFQGSTVEDFEIALARYIEDGDTPNQNNIEKLMQMIINAMNQEAKRPPNSVRNKTNYRVYSCLPGNLNLTIPEVEDLSVTDIDRYSPEAVARVFKQGPITGMRDIGPEGVSINISKSQPFRNHYLPLLEEFEESIRYFKWQYTFRLDIMKAYTRTPYTYNEDSDNFSLSFYKKMVGRYKKSYAARLQQALAIIGGIGAGSAIDQITNMGKLASEMLTTSSRRIANIIRTQRAQNPSLLINHLASDLYIGEAQPYCAKNTMMVEILLYIIANINIVLFFLDDDEFQKVLNNVRLVYREDDSSYIFYDQDEDGNANKELLLIESYNIAANRLGISDEESQDRLLYQKITKHRKQLEEHIKTQSATIQAINRKIDTRDGTDDVEKANKLYENSFNLKFLHAGNKEFSIKSLSRFLVDSRTNLLDVASRLTNKSARPITFTIS
jgi:endonuclease/exonuclease/phosphatase family metal-dependent hydrolase